MEYSNNRDHIMECQAHNKIQPSILVLNSEYRLWTIVVAAAQVEARNQNQRLVLQKQMSGMIIYKGQMMMMYDIIAEIIIILL